MQVTPRTGGQAPVPVKIYNAVYSSVQVYECMVRGIAVMRRRADSYVNATQILKVAGVDKGRRTKILEKEILPGKHEIVQGGYGKYQGTWIPLERGRDIALQYGVAPLLAPLFDFTPNPNALGSLPPSGVGVGPTRPLSASSSFAALGNPGNYAASSLAPPPIMPGSALRLLNQGRAQGLFTPSTSLLTPSGRQTAFGSPNPYFSSAYPQSPFQGVSPTPPPLHSSQPLKRARSDTDIDPTLSSAYSLRIPQPQVSSSTVVDGITDVQMTDLSRPPSSTSQVNGDDNPSPTKRARMESFMSNHDNSWQPQESQQTPSQPATQSDLTPTQATLAGSGSHPNAATNGVPRPPSSLSVTANGKQHTKAADGDNHNVRFATKPSMPRGMDTTLPLKDTRRAAIMAAICQMDEPMPVLDFLRDITPDNPAAAAPDIDLILDDQGHTSLHLAASLARLRIVHALVAHGADIHRGNYLGETPLIRACLATHNADSQSFDKLVESLQASIRTIDTSRKSVIHHIVSLAGVKGRPISARYYLDQIFFWIAQHQGGDFRSIVDLQDEHGDTALNIAARVGNRSLVRTLLDVGANRLLPNKLGLRPGDFGVETEELSAGSRAEDLLSSLRSGPSAPVQKSQDVITEMASMVQNLSTEFSLEIKAKQDSLDVTQAHLRAATRELSEQRKQIQAWQSRCGELDQISQRVRNLERAIAEEDTFDWTGRTDLSGKDARDIAGSAFQWRGQTSTMVGLGGSVDVSFNVEVEPPIPPNDSFASLIRLRRLKMWHKRVEELMTARLKTLQGASAQKEYQCKKIVALCTGIPIDKVESMLENLVIAVESESQIIDIGRVSGFMQKVRDGVI